MNPSPTTQQTAAREFVAFWTGKGSEKGQTQPFSELPVAEAARGSFGSA